MSIRIGLIMMIALFAGWVTLLAAFYVSANGGRQAALPSPQQLVAVTTIMERTTAADRPALIEALSGGDVLVALSDSPPDIQSTPVFNPVDTMTFEALVDALAPREVAILPKTLSVPGGVFASPINAVEFQIALTTGQTLLVITNSPVIVASIGLPVGFGAALIGILIALATLILLHREFRPLSHLAEAVKAVDPMGEPTGLPPIRARSPELRALNAAFQGLQDRLQVLIKGRMALIGGLQHDVRTFATRLRLRVDKISDPVERDRAIADIQDMICLLDDALLASRAGANELNEELIELAALVRSEALDRQVQDAEVILSVAPDTSNLHVLGDRLALRRVVANLVENAVKYGHSAHLSLNRKLDTLVLTVDDTGPGIPVAQRALLLEPFTRVEGSRARHTGGSGLGLAVAHGLLQAHQGTLEIGDAPGGGARVTVGLPIFALEPQATG